MEVNDLTIQTKDYQCGTYARAVRGTLYQHDPSHVAYALDLLAEKAPETTVIIPSTVKLHNYFEIVMPHPACKAEHADAEPVWWTTISARAFPDVDKDHARVVRLLGERLTVVRVPIIRPITAEDYSANLLGMA